MSSFEWIGWGFLVSAGAASLYGLHRLALRLEERGSLYYLRRKPSGTAGRFAPVQEILEPPARHVIQVRDELRSIDEDDTPEDDDHPPRITLS